MRMTERKLRSLIREAVAGEDPIDSVSEETKSMIKRSARAIHTLFISIYPKLELPAAEEIMLDTDIDVDVSAFKAALVVARRTNDFLLADVGDKFNLVPVPDKAWHGLFRSMVLGKRTSERIANGDNPLAQVGPLLGFALGMIITNMEIAEDPDALEKRMIQMMFEHRIRDRSLVSLQVEGVGAESEKSIQDMKNILAMAAGLGALYKSWASRVVREGSDIASAFEIFKAAALNDELDPFQYRNHERALEQAVEREVGSIYPPAPSPMFPLLRRFLTSLLEGIDPNLSVFESGQDWGERSWGEIVSEFFDNHEDRVRECIDYNLSGALIKLTGVKDLGQPVNNLVDSILISMWESFVRETKYGMMDEIGSAADSIIGRQ